MPNDDESRRKVTDQDRFSSQDADGGSTLDEHLQAHIGSQLKSMYDSYLHAPIPDRLVELLEQLDRVSQSGGHEPEGDKEPGE